MHPFIVNLYLAEPILDFVNKKKKSFFWLLTQKIIVSS